MVEQDAFNVEVVSSSLTGPTSYHIKAQSNCLRDLKKSKAHYSNGKLCFNMVTILKLY